MFNQQNAFGMTVFQNAPVSAKPARKAHRRVGGAAYGGGFAKSLAQTAARKTALYNSMNYPVRGDESEGCSLFKLAVRAG